MTDDELRAIEARADAATPGPWRWEGWALCAGQEQVIYPTNALSYQDGDSDAEAIGACGDRAERDASSNIGFIAHAREDIPALIAEIRRLRPA